MHKIRGLNAAKHYLPVNLWVKRIIPWYKLKNQSKMLLGMLLLCIVTSTEYPKERMNTFTIFDNGRLIKFIFILKLLEQITSITSFFLIRQK